MVKIKISTDLTRLIVPESNTKFCLFTKFGSLKDRYYLTLLKIGFKVCLAIADLTRLIIPDSELNLEF